MAKPAISTLFLDIGGVLLTNGWGHDSRRLAVKQFQLDATEMESRHRLTFDTYELGKLTLDEYLDRTVFYQERTFTRDEFRDFMYSQSQLLPGMIEMITALKKQYGLRVAVVNNEGRELNDYRIRKFRLASFVDFFISSSYVHFRKPDVDIFRLALDVAQVDATEVVYIDDRDMFTSVAGSLGINCITQVSLEDTIDKLAAFGLVAG